MAVGVMFITSKTFRDFVQAGVRDSNENILSLNLVSKSLVITEQGDFSNLLFVLDYEKVFGEAALPIPTFLTFKTVALHACVRSTVFYSSFDSMDLLRSIKRMDDLVYISAISSKWRHQSPHLEARDSVIPTESSSDEPSYENVTSNIHLDPRDPVPEQGQLRQNVDELANIEFQLSHLGFRNQIRDLPRRLAEQ